MSETTRRRLLDDVLDVFEPGEDRVWSETLCARLAQQWPDVYDPTALANALRAFGVDTAQVWGRTPSGEGANRRGVARQTVLDANATRDNTGPRASNRMLGDGSEPLAGPPAGLRPSEVVMLRPRALVLPQSGWGRIAVTEADVGWDEPVTRRPEAGPHQSLPVSSSCSGGGSTAGASSAAS